MALAGLTERPERPVRMKETQPPPLPVVDASKPDQASVQYSAHRTGLSTHRTALSEHRTSLSEYRTDLSGERTEMSMRRTGMSFQRTRMSADRTLMSVIRTSLSLIGFGFTIFQFFGKLKEAGTLTHAAAPRNFGIPQRALQTDSGVRAAHPPFSFEPVLQLTARLEIALGSKEVGSRRDPVLQLGGIPLQSDDIDGVVFGNGRRLGGRLAGAGLLWRYRCAVIGGLGA